MLKKTIKKMPIAKELIYEKNLYYYYANENKNINKLQFITKHLLRTKVYNNKDASKVICKLINDVSINSLSNNSFFYSIDPFKHIRRNHQVLDNYSIDYSWCVNESFETICKRCNNNSNYTNIVNSLHSYVDRIESDGDIEEERYSFSRKVEEIRSIFTRPAKHFHEAIQRILFVNQWLWQTGHKHNGFGHLDWILYDLYKKDLDDGYITKEEAKEYLVDFFTILHDKCWFKSTMLLGDTGQIVILGGVQKDGNYNCNELTYLFIDVSRDLKLPDPKVLLRVSNNMPTDLLTSAIECIATGIGAPFLSNDDIVIPSLIQYGYDIEDAYNYAASACWEPLTIGKSCDQNNIRTVNFCEPFVQFLDSDDFRICTSIEEIKAGYYKRLYEYLDTFLITNLDNKEFDEDPLLTLFNPEILKTGKDVVRGGAKYSNLGLTTVGMATVVNSLLNLESLVFEKNQFSLQDLNTMRMHNFEGNEDIRQLLNKGAEAFGMDSDRVIALTNEIMHQVSSVLEKHHTKLGGKYKYGLSSPNYIIDSKNIGATFDGRKEGQPFGVHISGKNGLSPTELISFASQLDYSGNRINGNVIDFILSPGFINNNIDKAVALIKGGIKQGFYQLQINVVDSKTLIEAQKNPEKYPNLVVRVWGFSAFFKDLPKEYQDNLIRRALDAEKAA